MKMPDVGKRSTVIQGKVMENCIMDKIQRSKNQYYELTDSKLEISIIHFGIFNGRY